MLDLLICDKVFTIDIRYRLFSQGGVFRVAGDGLVFVMHNDSRGNSALGSSGGYLGSYGPDGIQNGLFVELDTIGNDGAGSLLLVKSASKALEGS